MKTNIPEDIHVLEYMDKVDEMYEKKPKDKRTLEYREWRKEYNDLVQKINSWVGKIYRKE